MSQEQFQESVSREVARTAVRLAISTTREEERRIRESFQEKGIRTAAVDFGGDFLPSIERILERAVSAAKREGLIQATFREEGAAAGAAHEAICQIMAKATGLSVGGKMGIARKDDNVAVALFFSVGMMSLDEVCLGLGHRVL